MEISKKTLEQVKENRDLIESKNWLKIWETLKNPELNGAFVELGYNPLIGLKYIPSSYFSGSPVKSIVIPNSVTSIGDSAFYGCESLTSIVIPDSVTGLGNTAFYCCSSLTNIKYNGTKKQWGNISKRGNWGNNIIATKVICNDGEIEL